MNWIKGIFYRLRVRTAVLLFKLASVLAQDTIKNPVADILTKNNPLKEDVSGPVKAISAKDLREEQNKDFIEKFKRLTES